MKQIIKVIYQDGSSLEVENIMPLEIADDKKLQWQKQRNFERQFRDFEKSILRHLNDDTIENYAIDNFDLINQDDFNEEEKSIDAFDDDEIMEEVRGRKLLGDNNSIISENFIFRFSKIMEIENQLLLDNVLTEFEVKLNIISK